MNLRALLVVVAVLIASAGWAPAAAGRPATSSTAAAAAPAAAAPAVAWSTTGAVRSQVIGYSVQRRPIVAYELGDPQAAFTAVVLGSTHGYYERAGETVTRALRTMTMPIGLHLWVIDTINPDGDALHQRGNAHGVDLNRNWPFNWAAIPRTGCTAFDCHYSGLRALSEPETVAMTAFLKRVKPNRVVSLHQPLNGVDTTDGGARDPAFRNALARNLNLPLKAFTCFGGCHGTMTSWLTHATTATAIVVEFPQAVSSGYLSGQAARGILTSLMVGVRVPARPVVSRVTGTVSSVGSAGPVAGGNTVTVVGSGITAITKVTFGGTPGTGIKRWSSYRLTVVAPKHAAGVVNVRVTGAGGISAMTTKSRYTYRR